jgi:diaminopimelate epimerase
MQLTKHHGLGNDFLVLVGAPEPPVKADDARRLCDRRRGIGADGLIVAVPATRHGADAEMLLYNSDGSVAEMSGNGIRCLAQAIAMARGVRTTALVIDTGAGRRHLRLTSGPEPATAWVSVGMGPVGPGPRFEPGPAAHAALAGAGVGPASGRGRSAGRARWASADVGNPHLVVAVPDPWSLDVAGVGSTLEAHVPGGVNVEFIAPTPGRTDELDLTVWERGAGVTEACGTGACAAATVAQRWGLVGRTVAVHMPGGDVTVEVDDEVTLVGPTVYIGRIEVDLG